MLGLPKRTLIVIAVLVGVIVLYVLGSDKQKEGAGAAQGGGAAPAANASACRMTVTADILKVRAAPDQKAAQVGSYKMNAEVDAEKLVQNGYRKLGEGKWVSNEFVKPLQGRDCG
ncbi:SH3 domain-containing protein [Actinocrispum sp. NPDC049592]|uniref:SH3 domain-containing protein n=1 Tax=Actinocrispum sp. NPDC049592 TaxID=3154835 RepID=UPI0034464D4A